MLLERRHDVVVAFAFGVPLLLRTALAAHLRAPPLSSLLVSEHVQLALHDDGASDARQVLSETIHGRNDLIVVLHGPLDAIVP